MTKPLETWMKDAIAYFDKCSADIADHIDNGAVETADRLMMQGYALFGLGDEASLAVLEHTNLPAPSTDSTELARLRAQVFRPGVMRCAKCSFRLIRNALHVQSGGISAGDSQSEPCPNGCGPLWPVTWQDECKAADQLWFEQFERAERVTAAAMAVADRLQKRADDLNAAGDHAADEAGAAAAMIRSALLTPLPGQPLRPMSEAPREGRTPISARVTTRPGVLPERWEHVAGLWFTVRHGGLHRGEYDMGWQYPGHGGIPDHWFEGWWPLPSGDLDPTPQSAPA